MFKSMKKTVLSLVVASSLLAACGSNGEGEQVVLYTNGDEEAVTAMKNALNGAGYEGQYIVQSLGTSELGGKLLAEGPRLAASFEVDRELVP